MPGHCKNYSIDMYLVCGEALVDFLERPGHGMRFSARMGGSPLNLAVGIVRLGESAGILTCLSNDWLGQKLAAHLQGEGVRLDFAVRKDKPTTLAVAQLDENGTPQYAFYGEGASDRELSIEDLPNDLTAVSGIHFGSYATVVQPTADTLKKLLVCAADAGKFLAYDPNVRTTIERNCTVWRQTFDLYARTVDYLKMSMEDFTHLFPGESVTESVKQWLTYPNLQLVIITDDVHTIRAWHKQGYAMEISITQATKTIDSVGAGDSFQAAMLMQFGHHEQKQHLTNMAAEALRKTIKFASCCAAITCSRRGADLPHFDDVQAGD